MNPEQSTPQPQPSAPASQPVAPTPSPVPVASGPVVGGPVTGMPPAPSGNKKNMLIGIIVGAVVLVAAAAFGAYAYVTNTPDYVLKQAVTQFDVEAPTAAKFQVKSGQGGASITFSGDFAKQTDPTNKKNVEAVLGFGTGTSRISATVAYIDEALYFKLGNLKNLGNLVKSFGTDAADIYGSPQFLSMVENLNDQWFTLSKDELKGITQQATGADEVTGEFSADDLKAIKAIYDRHSFVRPDKVLADEDIEGVKSAHFSLKLDKSALVAFLKDVKAANLKSFQVTDDDIAEAEKAPEAIEGATIEAWVARDSKKLTQLQVATSEANQAMTVTVTFLTKLPTLEKITKPTDAKPVSELYSIMFGSSYGDLMGGGSDF